MREAALLSSPASPGACKNPRIHHSYTITSQVNLLGWLPDRTIEMISPKTLDPSRRPFAATITRKAAYRRGVLDLRIRRVTGAELTRGPIDSILGASSASAATSHPGVPSDSLTDPCWGEVSSRVRPLSDGRKKKTAPPRLQDTRVAGCSWPSRRLA